MKDLAARALDTARVRGATYADVRVLRTMSEAISVKNGIVDALSMNEDQGFGVRVVVEGAWGFASSSILTPEEADKTAALAVAIARASAQVRRKPVDLGPPVRETGVYRTPCELDPFAVSLEDKLALLMAADKQMRHVAGLAIAQSSFNAIRIHKVFASSEGSNIEQEITEVGAGIEATAVAENDLQNRSYPNSSGGQWGGRGFELVTGADLPGNAERIAAEAVALLTAKPCPSGNMDIVLSSSQVALQIHESCGHAVELDRALGMEASFAGTSFLTPDKLGTERYGSPLINITADGTTPGGLGTFGWDDEGVPAQRTPLIKAGVFVGYLTDRETAATLGLASDGTSRADGWNRIPMIRMVNVNLEPGEGSLEDLIAGIDNGILFGTNRSWSIDDHRLNFQFGTEIAWEIVNGKLGAILKNPTYTGITPQFWGSCDAVAGLGAWQLWGLPNCGKGEPMQVAHVGHGAAPARFRGVRVGVV
ncbi:MAG: TldD/PmbA family protein [Chloroflexia bacterium]